jgi:protein-L-isoaspartate O-methyltransferase
MVIPLGGPYEVQRLVVATKREDGSRESEAVTSVRFVPLTRGPQDRDSPAGEAPPAPRPPGPP